MVYTVNKVNMLEALKPSFLYAWKKAVKSSFSKLENTTNALLNKPRYELVLHYLNVLQFLVGYSTFFWNTCFRLDNARNYFSKFEMF